MKRVFASLVCGLFLINNLSALEITAPAASPETTAKAGSETEGEKKAARKAAQTGARPLYGKVAEFDTQAKAFKVGKVIYTLTDRTEFHNGARPASISDVKAGGKIGGSWVERDGKRELVRVNVGVKQTPAARITKKPETKTLEPEKKQAAAEKAEPPQGK